MANCKLFKRAAASCAAVMMTIAMAGTCYAGEWKTTDSGKQYIDNGTAVTGFEKINGEQYYFNSKGIMKTGWLKTKSGSKYYFDKNGIMRTGWLKAKSGTYYLDQNGKAVTGGKKINSYYYLFDDDGVMLKGWQDTDEGLYYYQDNGQMAVNKTLNIDGVRYKFNRYGEYSELVVSDNNSKDTSNDTAVYPTAIKKKSEYVPMQVGAKSFITFSFEPMNTTERDVTYKSSNENIIYITTNGEMTALKAGTCYITVTSAYDDTIFVKIKVVVS